MTRNDFIRIGTSIGLAALAAKFTGCASANDPTSEKPIDIDNQKQKKELQSLYPACENIDSQWNNRHWNEFVGALTINQAKDFLADESFGKPRNFKIDFESQSSIQDAIKLRVNQACGYRDSNANTLNYHDELVSPISDVIGIDDEFTNKKSTYEIEQAILRKSVADKWDMLSEYRREHFIKNSKWELSTDDKRAILAFTGVALVMAIGFAVKIAGFAIYTGLTSAMAALAGLIGVTIPFSIYTIATTFASFSFALIPIFLILLAALGVFFWLRPKSVDEKLRNQRAKLYAIMQVNALKCGSHYAKTGDVHLHAFDKHCLA